MYVKLCPKNEPKRAGSGDHLLFSPQTFMGHNITKQEPVSAQFQKIESVENENAVTKINPNGAKYYFKIMVILHLKK